MTVVDLKSKVDCFREFWAKAIFFSCICLVLCDGSLSAGERNNCQTYSSIFPNSHAAQVIFDFKKMTEKSEKIKKIITNHIRNDPFVYLIAAYDQVEKKKYTAALANLDISTIKFFESELCEQEVFFDLIIFARFKIFEDLGASKDEAERVMFSLMRSGILGLNVKIPNIYCALSKSTGNFSSKSIDNLINSCVGAAK